MPETIKIPGIKKPLPKNTVYILGAGAAGFVGYAWFTAGRSSGPEAPAEPALPEPVPEPTDEPGFGVDGGGPPPGTNADWTAKAIDSLLSIGIDGKAASSALGKFLQRQRLNKVEVDLVRQAIAFAGYPPENGPWTILEEDTGVVAPGLLAPQNFQAQGGPQSVNLTWSPVTGAVGYQTRLVGLPWGPQHTGTSQTVPFPPQTKANEYTFEVRAVGPTNGVGPVATAKATVGPSSGAGPGSKATLNLVGGGRTRTSITWKWNKIPGAHRYVIWPELGGQKRPQKSVPANSVLWSAFGGPAYRWTGLQPRHQYAITVVALDRNNREISNRDRMVVSTL